MSKYDNEYARGRNRQRQPHRTGVDTERRGNESVANVVAALRAKDLIRRPFIPCIGGIFPTRKFDAHDCEGIDAWVDIVDDDHDYVDAIGVARLAVQIKSSERGEQEFVRHHSQKLTKPIGTGRKGEYGMMLFNGQQEHDLIRRNCGVELLRLADIGCDPSHRDVQDFLRLCLHPDLAKDVMEHLRRLQRKGIEDPYSAMYSGRGNLYDRSRAGSSKGTRRRS